jgi:hypothetical protein
MVLFSYFKAYFKIDLIIQYQSAKVLATAQVATAASTLTELVFLCSIEQDEKLLFRLFRALATLHVYGNFNDALEEARLVWRRLPKSEPTSLNEIEVGPGDLLAIGQELRVADSHSRTISWDRYHRFSDVQLAAP